jgi:toxin ParE1/3/4
MSLAIRKSDAFLADLDVQFRWYEKEAGWDVAWCYLQAVDEALAKLAEHPELGWLRHFTHPELRNLRCWFAARLFHRHLIFYRHDQHTLDAVRVMHGARDLARRLRQPPGVAGDQTE